MRLGTVADLPATRGGHTQEPLKRHEPSQPAELTKSIVNKFEQKETKCVAPSV